MTSERGAVRGFRRSTGSLRRPTRLLTLSAAFLLLVLAALWSTVGALLQEQRRQAIDAETRQNANIARALQEQTLRVLSAVDQATTRLASAAARGSVPPAELQRIVDATGLSSDILPQLSLIDADGHFVGSNIDPEATKTGRVDLSDRDHVRVHLHPSSAGEAAKALFSPSGLFIGRPVLGKVSGKWTIQLSRPILGQDGHPLGVVVASLDPMYFEDVYRQVALGAQGGVSLVGGDGVLRARVIGGRSDGMGKTLSNSSRIVNQQTAASGHWVSVSSVDGIERITAYQRVNDYPLYVFAVVGMSEALAPWRTTCYFIVGMAALLTLVLCAAGWLVVRGVSRLESQHRALQISEAEAQAASEAKTQFLAAVSHELRTPLTSIRGYAELMERRAQEPMYKEPATFIRKASEQLSGLLSEIIDLSQAETGEMVFHYEELDVQALVDKATLPYRLAAQEKRLQFEIAYGLGLPSSICTDARRFRQVVGSLLSNAIKFTNTGGIRLTVAKVEGAWRVTVQDSGPGVPHDVRHVIFEKFRQADGRVSYEHGGIGLGLALARSVARRMGGDVQLDGSGKRGSSFSLTLPESVEISETAPISVLSSAYG